MEAARQAPRLPALGDDHSHGDERRAWSEAFLRYAYALVEQPPYRGMPCTIDDDGKIDWTIPTGRTPGSKNWDGNARRRVWWEGEAQALGIPVQGKWISQTARRIHPWGWKPCQTCGRWMRLSYAYPTARTIAMLNRMLAADEQLDVRDFLDIYEVAEHLTSVLGVSGAVEALASALPTLAGAAPRDLAELQHELELRVVRAEPRGRLSPGAMSNAPDRLDGFHTYNLCCRSQQDTGRSLDNLKTYGVDRRAFEHWSEGDWEAANLLMSQTVEGTCPRCSAFGRLSADHVGPISLGFRHTPFFEAVCLSCNSAKNNKMSMQDVRTLLALEQQGIRAAASRRARPRRCTSRGG
jgi:Alw26I/Eco31I/Esp3I family type II restriction endonuclease